MAEMLHEALTGSETYRTKLEAKLKELTEKITRLSKTLGEETNKPTEAEAAASLEQRVEAARARCDLLVDVRRSPRALSHPAPFPTQPTLPASEHALTHPCTVITGPNRNWSSAGRRWSGCRRRPSSCWRTSTSRRRPSTRSCRPCWTCTAATSSPWPRSRASSRRSSASRPKRCVAPTESSSTWFVDVC